MENVNCVVLLLLLMCCCFIQNYVYCLNAQAIIVNNPNICSDKSTTSPALPTSNIGQSRNIFDMNYNEKMNFINSFDLFLTDCDGVLWTLQSQIPGAGEAITELQKAGKKCAFLTNNSIRSEANYLTLFTEAGINMDIKDLLHPAHNIIEYLNDKKFNGLIYCIGTELFKDGLRNAGFRVVDGPNEIIKESYSELAKHIFDKEAVDAVVVDIDINVSGPKIIRAQMYLMKNPKSTLIIGATDMLLPVRSGINIIGPGPFGKMIAEATGKKPIILGKPGTDLCTLILKRYNITDPKRVLMVGDMLEQDIGFGKVCGFQTLAVLTGGCKKDDFNMPQNSELIPDYYTDSIANFTEFYDKLRKQL